MVKKMVQPRQAGKKSAKEDDKPWDGSLRTLVRSDPTAFAQWFLGEAVQVLGMLPEKLKPWKLETDALLQIKLQEEQLLLHLEFQTYHREVMAERLLRYNVLIRSEQELPVISAVIYLLRGSKTPASPLLWEAPSGQEILRFRFLSIELGEMSAEDFLALDLPGLLPLLPLTKNGATKERIEYLFERLGAGQQEHLEEQQKEQLTVASLIATLIFQKEKKGELPWLYRRLRAMQDFLRESPLYQDILSEGLEDGLEKGRSETMDRTLQIVVETRFPALLPLAKDTYLPADDPTIFYELIRKLSVAKDEQQAREYLLQAAKHGEKKQ